MKIAIVTFATAILLGTASAAMAGSDAPSNNPSYSSDASGENLNRPRVRVRSDRVSHGIGDDSRGSVTGGPSGGLIDKN